MNKPKMSKQIVILEVDESRMQTTVDFFATDEIANMLKEFGLVETSIPNNKHELTIDPRYNTDDIVEYMTNYTED